MNDLFDIQQLRETPDGDEANRDAAVRFFNAAKKELAEKALNAEPPDYNAAFEYYLSAAEEGNDLEAQFNLGALYGNGEGTEENLLMAAYWLKRAADQGYEDAEEPVQRASYRYFFDHIEAWSKADLYRETINYYRLLYDRENDVESANMWIFELADFYFRKQDYPVTMKCWHSLAEFGDSCKAMYNLSVAYYQGQWTEKDDLASLYWTDKAADSGMEEAIQNRDILLAQLKENSGGKLLLQRLSLWCRLGCSGIMRDKVKSVHWKAIADSLEVKNSSSDDMENLFRELGIEAWTPEVEQEMKNRREQNNH